MWPWASYRGMMHLLKYVDGVLQMLSRSRGACGRRTSCTAVAKYPPGIVTSEDEAEENNAVFLDDGELEDNAEEIAIDLARLAWETKVEDISVVSVAAQTSVCRSASHSSILTHCLHETCSTGIQLLGWWVRGGYCTFCLQFYRMLCILACKL